MKKTHFFWGAMSLHGLGVMKNHPQALIKYMTYPYVHPTDPSQILSSEDVSTYNLPSSAIVAPKEQDGISPILQMEEVETSSTSENAPSWVLEISMVKSFVSLVSGRSNMSVVLKAL